MLIDSHCHLHDLEFFTPEQQESMLARAKANGIEKIICIGTDHKDSLAAKTFAEANDNVYWTYGIHPNNWESQKDIFVSINQIGYDQSGASETYNDRLERAREQKYLFDSSRLVGIGEIGLDYHYGADNRTEQIKLFRKMLDLAREHNLPVSFHIREAFDDFFEVIKDYPDIRGVVHSFSDSKKTLKKLLDTTNFYIGVNGMPTYSTLPTPPLERIILETDAPFLTPTPFRGIINEPSYIKDIAEWLSTKLGVSTAKIAEVTSKNAKQLFRGI